LVFAKEEEEKYLKTPGNILCFLNTSPPFLVVGLIKNLCESDKNIKDLIF
jgi:hypothetical protein